MGALSEDWETPEYETLASLADRIVFRLPGCDDVMVRKEIASSYRDFCKRTCVLSTRRRVKLEHGVCEYPLVPKLRDCVIDCVVSITNENGSDFSDGYSFSECCVRFDRNRLPAHGEIRFVEIECVEIPKLDSESVPSMFIQRYGDAVLSGAVFRLQSMTGRPWSDPAMAARSAAEYENALTECRVRYYNGIYSNGSANFIKKGCLL